MKHLIPLGFCLLLSYASLLAQQVAIRSYQSDCLDGFAFVALTDLAAGTMIYFTDGPYVASSNSFDLSSTADVVLSYTVPTGGITEGTVISVQEQGSCSGSNDGNNSFTLARSGGGATGTILRIGTDDFDLSAGGEPLFAFSASSAASPHTTMTDFFGGIVFANGSPGDDPTADPNAPRSPDFWYLSTNRDNGNYTGNLTNTTLSQFTNTANWTLSNSSLGLDATPFVNPAFGGGAFPVELIDFQATAKQGLIELSWITASELNNDYFAIESSVDGRLYQELGRVKGAGTTSVLSHYQFLDLRQPASDRYYRLRQVNIDGSFVYSPMIQVEAFSKALAFRMYPNPVRDQLQVSSTSGQLKLFNATGQLIRQFRLRHATHTLDLSFLQKGHYHILFIDEKGQVSSHQLVR